jgi:hypothetical protein
VPNVDKKYIRTLYKADCQNTGHDMGNYRRCVCRSRRHVLCHDAGRRRYPLGHYVWRGRCFAGPDRYCTRAHSGAGVRYADTAERAWHNRRDNRDSPRLEDFQEASWRSSVGCCVIAAPMVFRFPFLKAYGTAFLRSCCLCVDVQSRRSRQNAPICARAPHLKMFSVCA